MQSHLIDLNSSGGYFTGAVIEKKDLAVFLADCVPHFAACLCLRASKESFPSLTLCLSPLPPQTYIGSVLVSVNPYKDLEIYSKQHMDRYRGVSFYEVSPHL